MQYLVIFQKPSVLGCMLKTTVAIHWLHSMSHRVQVDTDYKHHNSNSNSSRSQLTPEVQTVQLQCTKITVMRPCSRVTTSWRRRC